MKYITLILIALLFNSCDTEYIDYKVTAEVLSINEDILDGKLIGQFLGSSSGYIRNDVIKVGVSFRIDGDLMLCDLELQHSELAYYANQTYLNLRVNVRYFNGIRDLFYVYINNRQCYYRY